MTSLTTIGKNPPKLKVKLLLVGRVIVEGAEGSPTVKVPVGPTRFVLNPLEMKRLLVIVIGPAIVRLYVSPGLLSIAKPVVIRMGFEISRSPPVGRRC